MYCKKCGNEIKENETFCVNCGTSADEKINQAKEPIKVPLSIVIILLIIIIMVFAGVFLFVLSIKNSHTSPNSAINNTDIDIAVQEETKETSTDNKPNTEVKQTSTNVYLGNVSFSSMNMDDEKYTKIKQEIIDYFDNDYINFSVSYAQRYPQVFQNAKVTTLVTVEKVLKSTDEEFEVLAKENHIVGNTSSFDTSENNDEHLLIISGKQSNKRLLANDFIYVYGRFTGVESREIDGKTYMVSNIHANSTFEVKYNGIGIEKSRYSFQTIKDVAEYIFGKDIKMSKIDEYIVDGFEYPIEDGLYKVVLDNQSNVNFKSFIMDANEGGIRYDDMQENGLSTNITKRLFVSADFQHYIVSTYDENTKHVYIDYFDREFKKIWAREFDYTSSKAFVSPMDYTETTMAIVVDNDLFLINLETGENIIEPILVGEKIKLNMMSDGIVLIGDNNKDTIMKVDYTGKVLYRLNAETKMEIITAAHTQIVNGKLIVKLEGIYPQTDNNYNFNNLLSPIKYMVISNNGIVETSTEDLDDGYFLI